MKKNFLILVCVCFASVLLSQNLKIHKVQQPDAKTFAGKVNCIFQDKFGFVWFGKESGLERFDGINRKIYRNDPLNPKSISNNAVYAIADDSAGNLWIGTKGGGLNYFNQKNGSFSRFTHHTNDSSSISHDEVICIYPDGQGNYWIGTDGGGLNFFNPKSRKFKRYKANNSNKSLRSNSVLGISPAGEGKLWICTWRGGIHLFDTASGLFSRVGEGTPFAKCNVYTAKEVSPGILWLAASLDGLLEYNKVTGQFRNITPDKNLICFRDIHQLNTGEIYIATHSGLVYYKDYKSRAKSIEWATNDFRSVYNIYIDRTRTIWFGSADGVIGKINFHRYLFNTFEPGNTAHNTSVYSIRYQSPTKQFILFNSINFISFTPKSQGFEINKSSFRDVEPEFEMIGEKPVMISRSKGPVTIDLHSGKLLPLKIANKTHAILIASGAKSLSMAGATDLWVTIPGKVYRLAQGSDSHTCYVKDSIPIGTKEGIAESHYPTCFIERPNGDLWIGTLGGGLNWRSKGKKDFVSFKCNAQKSSSISDNFVECMAADSAGNIWVGTRTGLNRFDPRTLTFKIFNISNGLADDHISAIGIDAKNRVWVSTHKGISCVSTDQKYIRNYDVNDGLISNVFLPRSFVADKSGNFYFGGRNGLVWFNPNDITNNPHLPKVAIVGLEVNGKPVEVSDSSLLNQSIQFTNEIDLSYKQNSFSFRMAALSYFNPGLNKLKYKLKGYDKNWRVINADNVASYFDMPWGTYTFTVIAANEDGVWSKETAKIKVNIAPPLWLSPLGIMVYILVFSGFGAFYWLRHKKIKRTIVSGLTDPLGKLTVYDLIQPTNIADTPPDKEFLQKVQFIVEENMSDPDFGVDELCNKMNLSRRQLYRKFEEHLRIPISEFIRVVRLKHAAQLLLQKRANINEVAYLVGFREPAYFRKCFKQQFGITPTQYVTQNGTVLY